MAFLHPNLDVCFIRFRFPGVPSCSALWEPSVRPSCQSPRPFVNPDRCDTEELSSRCRNLLSPMRLIASPRLMRWIFHLSSRLAWVSLLGLRLIFHFMESNSLKDFRRCWQRCCLLSFSVSRGFTVYGLVSPCVLRIQINSVFALPLEFWFLAMLFERFSPRSCFFLHSPRPPMQGIPRRSQVKFEKFSNENLLRSSVSSSWERFDETVMMEIF